MPLLMQNMPLPMQKMPLSVIEKMPLSRLQKKLILNQILETKDVKQHSQTKC